MTTDTREQAPRERAVRQLKKRHDFYGHIFIYVLVNAFLVVIWAVIEERMACGQVTASCRMTYGRRMAPDWPPGLMALSARGPYADPWAVTLSVPPAADTTAHG